VRYATAPRGGRTGVFAFGGYLLVSFLYFGIPVLPHFGRDFIGYGSDPQLFAWSLAWWPHAILHGHNPFVSHVLWAPTGANLIWSTSVPGLAVLLAPVTLLAGPVAAYNVASILLPALAALTAFLLCRHVTGSFWPSLAGGYLFGFSSYLLGHELGHLHLTSMFLVPLAALFLLRFLQGELDGRGLVARLAPLLALQFSFGTELFFTLAVCLLAGLAVGALVVPGRRTRLRQSLVPIGAAYGVCALVVSPFVYYALSGYNGVVNPTQHNPADALTFAFPTSLIAVGGRWAAHFNFHIPPISAEDGQYLGLPAIAIVIWFAATRMRRPGSRFLVVALALAVLATLGSSLRVRGHDLFPLPWRAVRGLTLFDNVIPARFALYVSLVACLIVALWAAGSSTSRWLRIVLTAAAVLAIVPRVWIGAWHQHPSRPAFFADKLYLRCLSPGETVLMLPPPFRNQALLWQAESGFRFGLADGGLNDSVPAGAPSRRTTVALLDNNVPTGGVAELIAAARAQKVGAILVFPAADGEWRHLLDGVLPRRTVGGVTLYELTSASVACRQA
jgi:hypothetical protein